MNKWKAWVGIALIVVSAIGLFFWETSGRETFLTESVLVAADEIPAGTIITEGAFVTARIAKENLAAGALSAEAAASLQGSCARQLIPRNQQIVAGYFTGEEAVLKEKESVFVIPEEWIFMRSSSLRKGDRISLYGAASSSDVGTYRVAFVKDQGDQEVTEPEGGIKSDRLERTNSTAQISHLEIIATLEDYQRVRDTAQREGGLLAVQTAEQPQSVETAPKETAEAGETH